MLDGTDYINLDLAIEILSRHSLKAEEKQIKKSTTKIEGCVLTPSLRHSVTLLSLIPHSRAVFSPSKAMRSTAVHNVRLRRFASSNRTDLRRCSPPGATGGSNE
jgi:hypothetical protein